MFALLAGDLLAIAVAFVFGLVSANAIRMWPLGYEAPIAVSTLPTGGLVVAIGPLLAVIGCSAAWGHYERRVPFWSEYRDLLKSVAYAGAGATLVLFALNLRFSRTWTVMFLLTLCVTLPIGRALGKRVLNHFGLWRRPAIVVGDGPESFKTARLTELDRNLGLRIIDYVDIDSATRLRELARDLDRPEQVERDRWRKERPHVIVSITDMAHFVRHKQGFDALMSVCPSLTFLPPMRGLPLYDSELLPVFRHDTVMMRFHNKLRRRDAKRVKRAADLLLAGALTVLLSPVLAVLWMLVRLDGGPAFYGQRRIGENGRYFRCLKFRSMVIDADARLEALLASDLEARRGWEADHKLKHDPRITRIGRLLRATSLDELPQLINVLRGEMSLVGPRPIVDGEVARYGAQYGYYKEARPGVTGLWQVSGRNNVTYAERVALDVWYVRNWSPWLDLVILMRTVPMVLLRRGAY